ncbi:sigma-54-dependent transcriptional regulator [Listeria monocytogenes]|nr:sigma-54-dependent transcriptional regulator [Listeria monocytogenes]EBF5124624.1 sigma-54-dependent transcriptional regulator [Listeria monocytogenes]
MFDLMDNLLGVQSFGELNKDMPTTLFVTDADGNILISNKFTALTVGMSLEELLRCNVRDLVEDGVYNDSVTLEAIRTKQKKTKVINTKKGFSIRSTSTPILYPDGTVHLVVTMSDETQPDSFKTWRGEAISDNKESLLLEDYKENDGTVIVAESVAMKQIVRVCNQIAPFDSKVLLYGESGTGKEVLSRYIHEQSEQAAGPFISINCAAIPKALFESELFGHEKGSFTGADIEKPGMLELADGGTLFLDEISEMPLELQAKMLRVLETGEVRRLGSTTETKRRFRLISATNRNLGEMVEKGTFRRDLYYRINVVPVHIPALRERPQDIIGLARQFIQKFNQKYQKDFQLSGDKTKELLSHNWPGNVRELRNQIERLVVMSGNKEVKVSETDDFALDLHFKEQTKKESLHLKDYLQDVEKHFILRVLEESDGNVTKAASVLGIHRSVLYRKLKTLH